MPGTVSDSYDPVAKAEVQGQHAGFHVAGSMYLCLQRLIECMIGGHNDNCFSRTVEP